MAIDTGHGAAITFGTSALALNWTQIGGGNKSRPPIESTKLSTTGSREFVAGDLDDEGEFTVPFQWDDTIAEPATSAAAETVTITYSGGATLAGSALITNVKRPDAATGALKMGELTIKWDGVTGPTFTVES